jgi:xyloglucan-specific endo-beta-1,4-glucanase
MHQRPCIIIHKLINANTDARYQVGNDDGFNATWNWWKDSHSVHSYPNVQLNSDLLPVELAYLSSLQVRADWTMNSTQDLYSSHDHPAAWIPKNSQAEIKANVALDLFLDPNPQRANVTTLPLYELMIWFSALPGVAPIGWSQSDLHKRSYILDNTTL